MMDCSGIRDDVDPLHAPRYGEVQSFDDCVKLCHVDMAGLVFPQPRRVLDDGSV